MSRQHPPLFVLDTNVFAGGHNDYYAPDFCPAFWDLIPQYFHAGRLISIDRVFDEITKPSDLVRWGQNAPSGLFAFTGESPTVTAYTTVVDWVWNNPQCNPAAKREFARVADGWLVAYAKTCNALVVTHEADRPEAKSRVPLPNVCRQFKVPFVNTWGMLRQLGVRFDLRPSQ